MTEPGTHGATGVLESTQEVAATAAPWVTIVWDDPVNLMSYVTYVFQDYFSYSAEKAERLMLEVHNQGKAVVSSGNREAMERDVIAMQNYTLWATMERA
ncbi:MAG: ATP-dependent Clp protease adapter ClpS [Arachnia sp.]